MLGLARRFYPPRSFGDLSDLEALRILAEDAAKAASKAANHARFQTLKATESAPQGGNDHD